MKNSYLKSIYILFVAAVFISCDNKQSLQEYYIEKQEDGNFISLDIPASIFSLKEGVSQESKEILSSLKKVNILAFQINEENKSAYPIENSKIKEIIKGDSFNELIRGTHKNIQFRVKYLGKENAIDEVILYASDKEKGFVVARILGDNMNPEKIMQVVKDIEKMDKDNPVFSQLGDLLGGL